MSVFNIKIFRCNAKKNRQHTKMEEDRINIQVIFSL
jgi:hypothetical protein